MLLLGTSSARVGCGLPKADMLPLRRYEPLLRTLGATTAVGMLLGAVIGGLGGRLAMRALFLTTGASVRGVVSDDGFRIGEFSVATANLVFTSALFGIVGAVVYLGVRSFLIGPQWLRSLTCSLAAGAVIGSLLVHADGVDFTVLSPVWLAIALFVGIPALFGAVTPAATEWMLRPAGWARTARLRWVTAPLLVYLFPPLLVVVGVPVGGVLGARYLVSRSTALQDFVRRQSVMWTARMAWLSIALLGVAGLADDIDSLL